MSRITLETSQACIDTHKKELVISEFIVISVQEWTAYWISIAQSSPSVSIRCCQFQRERPEAWCREHHESLCRILESPLSVLCVRMSVPVSKLNLMGKMNAHYWYAWKTQQARPKIETGDEAGENTFQPWLQRQWFKRFPVWLWVSKDGSQCCHATAHIPETRRFLFACAAKFSLSA